MPINWKGTNRKPIPDAWRFVASRTSGKTGTNRHSTHPFNAILNYAYGVLESQVRIDAVAAGLDPTIGYLHASQPGRLALVYDLMEPQRPVIDREILKFIAENELHPNDFLVAPNGVCRLHPQLARTVTAAALRACKAQDSVPVVKKKEELVWNDFVKSPKRCHDVTMAISAAILAVGDCVIDTSTERNEDEMEDAPEGRLLTVTHKSERSVRAATQVRSGKTTG